MEEKDESRATDNTDAIEEMTEEKLNELVDVAKGKKSIKYKIGDNRFLYGKLFVVENEEEETYTIGIATAHIIDEKGATIEPEGSYLGSTVLKIVKKKKK